MKTTRVVAAAVITAVILAAVFFKSSLPFAQTSTPPAASLWVATVSSLLKFDASSGSAVTQIPVARNQLRLAGDETRQILWSYSQGTLSAFDASGTLVAQAAVPPSASATTNLALAVNPADGSVWRRSGGEGV